MREIKFRGKRLDNGEWEYGSLLQSEIAANGYVSTAIVGRFANSYDIGHFSVDPKTVGQYTGLKDKNGNEIYECDILHTEIVKPILVIWRNDLSLFALRNETWGFDHYFGEAIDPIDCVVIGNIHDKTNIDNRKSIKKHCIEKKVKIKWLAEQLSVTPVAVSKWNSLEIRPHRLFIERICEILDINQDDLLLKTE